MSMRQYQERIRSARAWAARGAALTPGIMFTANVDGLLFSFEADQKGHVWSTNYITHSTLPQEFHQVTELGFKDSVEGRWVWSDDLDRYTRRTE